MTDDTGLAILLRESFPEPEPGAPVTTARVRRRMSRRRTWTVFIVVVVLAASAGGVWAATGSSAATYRWTTARKGSVDQTPASYGTIVPIHQAAVAFPVGGTVATVPVKVGQHVTSGQPLATLEVSGLQSKLDSARATLATAQARLVSDTQAQATGTTVASTTGGTSGSLGPASVGPAVPLTGGSPSGKSGAKAGGTGAAQAAVTAAQAKLLADQHAVDNLTSVVTSDLNTGTATCASLITSLHNLSATPAAPAPGASPSASGGGSGGSGSGGVTIPDTSACTTLLNKILADQQAVTAAQATVSTDEMALTGAVAQLVAAAQQAAQSAGSSPATGNTSPSTTGGSGRGSGTGPTPASTAGSGGPTSSNWGSGGGGGGTLVTAAQLVVDQTSVDADTAAMIVAAEGVNQATLISPLAGTVAAVGVSPGSSASTQTAAVTVIGPGADQVTTTVSDLHLGEIHLGQSASVTTDASNTPIAGKVTAIGLLPVSTSSSGSSGSTGSSSTSSTSSSATYPVTISLATGGLYSGSGADVSIVMKRSTGVLTVPTSAVTALGTRHTVTVQQGGKAVRKLVEVGAADATLTQITSGLAAGDRVALVQLNLALPTSSSTLTGRGTGLGRTGPAIGAGGGTGLGRPTVTSGRGG